MIRPFHGRALLPQGRSDQIGIDAATPARTDAIGAAGERSRSKPH